MHRAVFLDRDGVINRALVRDGKPFPPDRLEDFQILPDAPQALRLLNEAGFLLIIATNQPDVARGTQRKEVVEAMHRRLMSELPIDGIEVCYEIETPESEHYKPKPGMLIRAALRQHIDLKSSYMVGDRWRDIDCGHAAGCFTIFIDRGYSEALHEAPDATCSGLLEAAQIILQHSGHQ